AFGSLYRFFLWHLFFLPGSSECRSDSIRIPDPSGERRALPFLWEACNQMAAWHSIVDYLKKVSGSAHWLMIAVTVILFGLVVTLVDLKPRVEENFFFSSNDPQFEESKKIDERFPSGSQLVLSVSSSDISSEHYLERLG